MGRGLHLREVYLQGVCIQGEGGLYPGWSSSAGSTQPPPPPQLEKWAVCILLACFLVVMILVRLPLLFRGSKISRFHTVFGQFGKNCMFLIYVIDPGIKHVHY